MLCYIIFATIMNTEFTICIRKRPCVKGIDVVDVVETTESTISIKNEKQKVNLDKYTEIKSFNFDKVYSESQNTQSIYLENINKYVNIETQSNFICYALGETGSGKTYTLFGPNGIIELTLCNLINTYGPVNVSTYEIYNDQIYDLLNKKTKVIMLESRGSIHINGLTTHSCGGVTDVSNLFNTIKKNRSIGLSSENTQSSRSHCVVHIKIRDKNYIFVDLAGSERGIKSKFNNKKNHQEMTSINTDIFHLKECIRCAKIGKQRIPFRSTKLTMILRDSFCDNYSSLILVTISPEKSNTIETINILSCVSDIKIPKKKLNPLNPLNPLKNVKINNVVNVVKIDNVVNITDIIDRTNKTDRTIDTTSGVNKLLLSEKNKKYNRLTDLILKEMKIFLEFLELTEIDEFENLSSQEKELIFEKFGYDMATILTNQVNVIRTIDEKFGRKFFAMS